MESAYIEKKVIVSTKPKLNSLGNFDKSKFVLRFFIDLIMGKTTIKHYRKNTVQS